MKVVQIIFYILIIIEIIILLIGGNYVLSIANNLTELPDMTNINFDEKFFYDMEKNKYLIRDKVNNLKYVSYIFTICLLCIYLLLILINFMLLYFNINNNINTIIFILLLFFGLIIIGYLIYVWINLIIIFAKYEIFISYFDLNDNKSYDNLSVSSILSLNPDLKQYFDILEFSDDEIFNKSTLNKHYRDKAKTSHSDKAKTNYDEVKWNKIVEAKEVLSKYL